MSSNTLAQFKNIREEFFVNPKREYDQFFATPETSIKKAEVMLKHNSLNNKDILILGDDDFVSLACCLVGSPKSVTVAEIDSDIANYISKVAALNNFPITVINSDVRSLNLPTLGKSFDSAAFDPPYTTEGAALFLRTALKKLKLSLGASIFLCYGAGPKNEEKILKLQKMLNSLGLVILEKIPNHSTYTGADGVKNTSSMYVLQTTPKSDYEGVSFGEKEIYTFQVPPKVRLPYIAHFSLILHGVNVELITTYRKLDEAVVKSCNELKLKWVSKSYKKFSGGGITLNFVLEKSNLSVHTWPEYKIVHIDLLTCSRVDNISQIPHSFAKNLNATGFEFSRLE